MLFGIGPIDGSDAYGNRRDDELNLNWSGLPLGATTDRDGRFTIRGLPREKLASLAVDEPRHETVFALAATTDVPQPDLVSSTARNETRQPIHTGQFTLTAKVADHILVGRVVLEADGKPVARARVIYNGIEIAADQNGRFRIEALVSGTLELHVSQATAESDAAPLAFQVEIPETPREIERTFKLARGLIVTGRVVDATNGNGVEKALVEFHPRNDPAQTPAPFSFSRETTADGRFRLVVPPGRGTIALRTFPLEFPQQGRRDTGEPNDPAYVREVEGGGGQTIQVEDFKLTKGREVRLTVVDGAGRPLANAAVSIQDPNRPADAAPGRTDAQGRYAVVGLAPEESTVVDLIDTKRSLGATIEISGHKPAGSTTTEMQVGLQPLVSLSGSVLDDEGKPLSDAAVRLFRDVSYPKHGGRSFGVLIETQNEINGDGTYTFDHLIAGATYNTSVEISGHPSATSDHVTINPGQPARLKAFRLPAVDQEVRGVVVDPRGKPLSGVVVTAEQTRRTEGLDAP